MKNLLIFLLCFMLIIVAVPTALAEDTVDSNDTNASSDTNTPAVTSGYTAFLKKIGGNWFAWTWNTGEGRWVSGEFDGYGYYKFDNLDKNVVFACVDDDNAAPAWSETVARQTVDIELDNINKLFVISGNNEEGKYTGFLTTFDESKWGQGPTMPTTPSSESASYTAPSAPTSESPSSWNYSETDPTSASTDIKPSSTEASSIKPTDPSESSGIKPSSGSTEPTQQGGKVLDEVDNAASAKASLNLRTATVKCGKTISLKVSNKGKKKVTYTSSNKKVAKVSKSGKVSALKKGFARITAKVGTKKYYFTIKVTSSPKLSKSNITVDRGKTAAVKIIGKCGTVKNVYTNTKRAKIISKASAKTLKIRGLKKGATTLKIKVNGVVLKLKVEVK